MTPFERAGRVVEDGMKRHAVPGVVVGVLREGRTEVAGFGVTSVEDPLPVDGDTLFLVASNTKPFTATTAMRLVEEGKLDLNAPLSTYVPELRLSDPDAFARATLWHCFTHTGGWLGDHAPDTGYGDDAVARAVASMGELPQWTPLGEVYSYNNIGFTVAGRAIEIASGKTYEAAVTELVLEPLGMERSFFFAEDAITRRTSAGHNVVDGEPRVVRPWTFPRSATPMGGLISCAPDMLRWARFAMGEGAPLLRPETMRQMQTQQVESTGDDAVGLSWMLSNAAGTPVVGHGGYAPGQMSAFRVVPSRGLGLFVATNSDHGARLYAEILPAIYREYLDLRAPEPATISMPASDLTQYAGRYSAPLDDVQLRVEGDALRLETVEMRWLTPEHPSTPRREPPPPTRLGFVAPDKVLALDPPQKGARGEFLRDREGRITWLRWGGRIHRRVD